MGAFERGALQNPVVHHNFLIPCLFFPYGHKLGIFGQTQVGGSENFIQASLSEGTQRRPAGLRGTAGLDI
jgi:hypothetical protein